MRIAHICQRTVGNKAPNGGALWMPDTACNHQTWTSLEDFEEGNDSTRTVLWRFILAAMCRMD